MSEQLNNEHVILVGPTIKQEYFESISPGYLVENTPEDLGRKAIVRKRTTS